MDKAVNFIKDKIGDMVLDTAVVLGSGLGDFTDGLVGIEIPYSDIDGMPKSSVEGHKGSFFIYSNNEKNIVIMQGRVHLYEGYPISGVIYPIKLFKKLGVKNLILTNAAGAVSANFAPGDLLLIKDHINLMGSNPLIGPNDDNFGVRFPDMSEVYDSNLRMIALNCASNVNVELKEGVYAATTGPSYETPAEVRMLNIMGADVVGMSTVPEAIVANWAGIKVLAISLVSNYAAGIRPGKLTHSEVIGAGKVAAGKVKLLLNSILENI